jgi:hypothetical protein
MCIFKIGHTALICVLAIFAHQNHVLGIDSVRKSDKISRSLIQKEGVFSCLIDNSREQSIDTVAGLFDETIAYTSKKNITSRSIPLQVKLREKGALSFWFYLKEDIKSSKESKTWKTGIELPNFGKFYIQGNQSGISLESRWGKSRKWLPLPSLSQGWHHYAWRWNSKTRVREGFLNGNPMFPSYQMCELWEHDVPEEIKIMTSEQVYISDIQISDQPFTDNQLLNMIPKKYFGRGKRDMGIAPLGSLQSDEQQKGTLLYENHFKNPSDIEGWEIEGKAARVEIKEDGMHQWHVKGDWVWPEGHFVHWCPEDFPENFIAEWEIDILSKEGLCIVFFGAKGQQEKDLFDESLRDRKGHFGNYIKGDIDCYHISYFAFDRVCANLRRNAGFYLAANGPIGIRPDHDGTHKVKLLKQGGRIVLAVDGQKCIDFVDDGKRFGEVHGVGKIGFRQMFPTHAVFKSFRVWELKTNL